MLWWFYHTRSLTPPSKAQLILIAWKMIICAGGKRGSKFVSIYSLRLRDDSVHGIKCQATGKCVLIGVAWAPLFTSPVFGDIHKCVQALFYITQNMRVPRLKFSQFTSDCCLDRLFQSLWEWTTYSTVIFFFSDGRHCTLLHSSDPSLLHPWQIDSDNINNIIAPVTRCEIIHNMKTLNRWSHILQGWISLAEENVLLTQRLER